MPTLESVDSWIQENILDSNAWDNSTKQQLAVDQATRNLKRWYPDVDLTDELISYQSIWELQGTDPALKFQSHGVKSVSEGPDRIDYAHRDKVAPDVRDILGPPSDEKVILEGGVLY